MRIFSLAVMILLLAITYSCDSDKGMAPTSGISKDSELVLREPFWGMSKLDEELWRASRIDGSEVILDQEGLNLIARRRQYELYRDYGSATLSSKRMWILPDTLTYVFTVKCRFEQSSQKFWFRLHLMLGEENDNSYRSTGIGICNDCSYPQGLLLYMNFRDSSEKRSIEELDGCFSGTHEYRIVMSRSSMSIYYDDKFLWSGEMEGREGINDRFYISCSVSSHDPQQSMIIREITMEKYVTEN